MGTLVGLATRPLPLKFCAKGMIKNTISLSWRLGKAVILATKEHDIGNIGKVLVDALGGPKTAKVLFAGKIIEIERQVFKGHTVGKVVVGALARDESEDSETLEMFEGTLTSEEIVSCVHAHSVSSSV